MSEKQRALEALAAAQWKLALRLTAAMMVVYFGFILLVAFDKPLLGRQLVPGLSLGILLGALVIVAAWIADLDLRALGEQPLRRDASTRIRGDRPMSTQPRVAQRRRHRLLLPVRLGHARDHLLGGAPHAQHRALLRRRPQRHRPPERPRARRRLHERRELPRHRRPGGALGLRRPDLLDRLAGRLAGRAVPDRRAAAQPRAATPSPTSSPSACARRRCASPRRSARSPWSPST